MSSNRFRKRLSLRTRLLVGLFALLAAACVGVAGANEFALHRHLVAQLDEQLLGGATRASVIYGSVIPTQWRYRPQSPNPEPGPRVLLNAPGQPVGLVAAVLANGVTGEVGVLKAGGVREDVSPAAAAELAAAGGERAPVTRNLDGLGRYRLVSTQSRLTGNTLVIGLSMSDLDDTLVSTKRAAAGVIAATLVLATVLGALIIRRAMAPLTRVVATAGEVAELPLDRGEVALRVRVATGDLSGRTEVGRLGLALNRMLDHIARALTTRQASENRMRQFVADVSHELRTPLTIVRGYAELIQRQRDDVPADVADAMVRLDYQAQRMSELVEDLLLLARLDSGRPLKREQVDLTRLCAEAVSDARAAGPDHRWTLSVPSGPLYVAGDDSRLYLSLANLLGNARMHTPPGTSVAVSLCADADAAVLRVVDDGPGVPASMQSEVFGRFTRGDPSRSRKNGSTGLGLAIVSAVLAAHEGSVVLHSAPGRTEFTVRMPREA